MQRHSDKHVFLRNPEILHSGAIPSQKPHNDDPFALGGHDPRMREGTAFVIETITIKQRGFYGWNI
jgi:hypothetical protein